MQSHTTIDVAITCRTFSHYLPLLQEGFYFSFKFRHICIHGCQTLRHTHVQGWVDGTVNHFWYFWFAFSAWGITWLCRLPRAPLGIKPFGNPALPVPTVFYLPLLKDSPGKCIFKFLSSPQPSPWLHLVSVAAAPLLNPKQTQSKGPDLISKQAARRPGCLLGWALTKEQREAHF